MLNLLQRATGIATATRAYVEAVTGTRCRILHTRKTAPGLRALDIAAVLAGGGTRHRVDPAHEILGLRLNAWVSLVGIVVGVTWYVLSQRRERPSGPRREKPLKPARRMAVPGGRVRPRS